MHFLEHAMTCIDPRCRICSGRGPGAAAHAAATTGDRIVGGFLAWLETPAGRAAVADAARARGAADG